MATLAPALVTLRNQINARFPGRSKASDGWIGDAAHAAQGGAAVSQHNPNAAGVVCAVDITEDTRVGLDCNRLMDELDASNDPRIFYLIHDYQIDNSDDSRTPYRGSNPHTKHLHISTWWNVPARYNDGRPWNIPMLAGAPAVPPVQSPGGGGAYAQLGQTGENVRRLQGFMTDKFRAYNRYPVTGYYGPLTQAGMAEFQRRAGVTGPDADGSIVGPRTMAALRRFGFRG